MKILHITILLLLSIESQAKLSGIEIKESTPFYRKSHGSEVWFQLQPGEQVRLRGIKNGRQRISVKRGRKRYLGYIERAGEWERTRKARRESKIKNRILISGVYSYYFVPSSEVELSTGQTFVLSDFKGGSFGFRWAVEFPVASRSWAQLLYQPRQIRTEGTSSVQLTSSNSTPLTTIRVQAMDVFGLGLRSLFSSSSFWSYGIGAALGKVSSSKTEFSDGVVVESDVSEISMKFLIYGTLAYELSLSSSWLFHLDLGLGLITNNDPKVFYADLGLGLGYRF